MDPRTIDESVLAAQKAGVAVKEKSEAWQEYVNNDLVMKMIETLINNVRVLTEHVENSINSTNAQNAMDFSRMPNFRQLIACHYCHREGHETNEC